MQTVGASFVEKKKFEKKNPGLLALDILHARGISIEDRLTAVIRV